MLVLRIANHYKSYLILEYSTLKFDINYAAKNGSNESSEEWFTAPNSENENEERGILEKSSINYQT